MKKSNYSLGIVGVRGYVGKELLSLVSKQQNITIDWVSSRQLAGQSIDCLFDANDDWQHNKIDCTIEELSAEQVATRNTDIIVLALPNGLAEPYVKAIENHSQAQIIIDLSADYRFSADWIYSLPELDYQALQQADNSCPIKISNPGCYATAMQLALAPVNNLLSAPAHCFGVSGYSGAGTKPSPNNDPDNLKDNLIGYALVEHLHEKEVSARLQKPVRFSPHVAAFFRGINMTVQVEFSEPQTAEKLYQMFTDYYDKHPLVNCQQSIPVIRQVTDTANCLIGGFAVSEDGKKATIISCLDNLLKGAASQALQNINLALGEEQ